MRRIKMEQQLEVLGGKELLCINLEYTRKCTKYKFTT
jgi:hypothetical protein